MKANAYFLFIGFIISLGACQTQDHKNNSEPVFADFYIRYLEEEGKLRAEASFFSGDSLKNAKPKTFNAVFFQGGAMELRDLKSKGKKYRSERSLKFNSPFNFNWKNEDGTPSSFDLKMEPINDISIEGNLSQQKTAILNWKGSPLSDKESLVVVLTDSKNQTTIINKKGPLTDNRIEIKPEDLTKLSSGVIKVYLVKKNSEKIQKESTFVESAIEFYSKTFETELQD